MLSTWTKRVAAALAAAATLALVAGGSSAVASSSGLSVHVAKKLAHKLEAKQKRERSLRWTELGKAHRRSANRIDFSYRDRSTSEVYCTARIVVVQSSDSRRADLRHVQCRGVPSDVLGYEKAIGALTRDVPDLAPAVRKSLRHYDKGVGQCDYVAVPKNRAKDVDALMSAGFTYAFYKPLRARLGKFDDRLKSVDAADPELVRGEEAWDRTLIIFDELPGATHEPCAAVKTWAQSGWTDDTAPADFGKLHVERRKLRDEENALDEVSAHLVRQGLRTGSTQAFEPEGLEALLVH